MHVYVCVYVSMLLCLYVRLYLCCVYIHIPVRLHNRLAFPNFVISPLAGGIVDLIALAAAYCDGVEGLEGAQANAGDGHEVRGEHDQDGLGVVEGH